jgi:hypothetical protein
MKRLLLAFLIGAAVLAVGWTVAVSSAVASPSADPERPTTWELRDCRTRGESNSPQKAPVSPGVRIGPLIIWPTVRMTGRTNNATWMFAAKAPIVLPARTKVVLAIAPEAISRAAFQSHRSGYVSAVRFEACREREPAFAYRGTVGKLTGFPFAIGLTQKSACIPMDVWIDGQATPIRRIVPVGRRSC